jgi:hypothetical protein
LHTAAAAAAAAAAAGESADQLGVTGHARHIPTSWIH